MATLVPWAISFTTFVLIPKCPACVAAYVFFFTGIGVSLSAATAMRWALIVLCFAPLAWLVFGAARRSSSIEAAS